MLTMDSITVGSPIKVPRLVLYGVHGIGKTTFACEAPSPIVLRTEDGLGKIKVPTFPIAKTYGDVFAAISLLYKEPHRFQTLVLDSLDWLEPLIWQLVAQEAGKDHIEDIGYGKGYLFAVDKWATLLEGLRALQVERTMGVILIAHSEIKRFDAPETQPYDRYQIKLHKTAAAKVEEWAEIVGFAHYEVHVTTTAVGFDKTVARGVGVGRRLLGLEERPAYRAKNRFALPPVVDLRYKAFLDACTQALTPPAAPVEPSLAAVTVSA